VNARSERFDGDRERLEDKITLAVGFHALDRAADVFTSDPI